MNLVESQGKVGEFQDGCSKSGNPGKVGELNLGQGKPGKVGAFF